MKDPQRHSWEDKAAETGGWIRDLSSHLPRVTWALILSRETSRAVLTPLLTLSPQMLRKALRGPIGLPRRPPAPSQFTHTHTHTGWPMGPLPPCQPQPSDSPLPLSVLGKGHQHTRSPRTVTRAPLAMVRAQPSKEGSTGSRTASPVGDIWAETGGE